MIKSFLLVLNMILCFNVNATHWATYFVYIETEHVQGPWCRMEMLESSDYKYLSPKQYEDLFGSEPEDMARTMISHLAENKPELYNWEYKLKVNGDTVIISIEEDIKKIETILNEITLTLTLNSFSAVTFQLPGSARTMILNDIKIPFLDLVINEHKAREEEHKEQSPFSIWLLLSIGINVILVGLLIYRVR